MLIQPYQLEELRFACCFRVYYRWRTHRASLQPALRRLDRETLDSLLKEYGIHILEASASHRTSRSSQACCRHETVAACASKMKGRVSKWLRGAVQAAAGAEASQPRVFRLHDGNLDRGGRAGVPGSQGEHHGYMSRPLPPVFVASYSRTPEDEQRLSASHAVTVLQFHIVLSTWRRTGVFGQAGGRGHRRLLAQVQRQRPMFIEKVSFVPDHVHLAVRTHPSLSPAAVVVALMNASQELIWKDFANSVIRGRVERLWQPKAYVGSYGDLESAKIAAYVRKWEAADEELM